MKAISFYSYDGGCGKTTSTANIARHLAQMGIKVLCIDLDPKASLTARLGPTEYQKNLINTGINISSVLLGEKPLIDALVAIDKTLYLVGTEIPAPGVELSLPLTASKIQKKSPAHDRLFAALAQAESLFDICLIDCPPAADILAINAIYAADWVISPVRLDEESVTDTQNVIRMIEEIGSMTDRKPQIMGLIFTQTAPHTRQYKETWPQVVKLGAPVLAEIKLFTGADARKRIFSGYETVVDKILQGIKEGQA